MSSGPAGWPALASSSQASRRPGTSAPSDDTTYGQKDPGSVSPASRETQATFFGGSVVTRDHSASSVVLPKPGGADSSVSLAADPASSRSSSRDRTTSP